MKHLIVIAVVLISLQSTYAQHSKVHFVDSDKVIEDLRCYGVKSDFYTDLDYEALIYLHPNEFNLLNKLKPRTLHLIPYEDYQGAIRDLPFQGTDIKNLFGDKEKLREIIAMVSPETDFKCGDIYYKSPDKVFVNINGNRWSSSYGFQLVDGKLKLKSEIKNIE